MKQLNGTITLSFLEEDNQQRVIFRVIPLCTREGAVFHTRTIEFPDQGSLRIVPDKREQSTFKERMRSMGCLCAIQLLNEGKELGKVRQNRNYDPNQGERNQFAIYSDVVCEFTPDGVFEVYNENEEYGNALSPRVLIRRGQVLYGPLDRAEKPDWATLRPFGNDSYLLQTVELPNAAQSCFYWNPEQTLNWRQRRGTLRHGKPHEEGQDDEPEDEPSAPSVQPLVKPNPIPAPVPPVAVRKPEFPGFAAVSALAEAAPVVREAAPVVREPAPVVREPVPVVREAALVVREPVPVVREAAPVVREAAPAVREPAPIVREPALIVREPAPVIRETVPVVREPVPEPRQEEPAAEPLANPEALRPTFAAQADSSLPIGMKLEILNGDISFEDQLSQLDQPLPMDANLLAHASSAAAAEEQAEAPLHFSGTPLVKTGVKPPLTLRGGGSVQNVIEREVREAYHREGAYPTDFKPLDNPVDNLCKALETVWASTGTQRQALETLSENEAFTQAFLLQLRQNGGETGAVKAAQDQLADIEAERLSLLMELDAAKSEDKAARDALCASMNQKKRDEVAKLEERARALRTDTETLHATLISLGEQAQGVTLEALVHSGAQLCTSNGETVALSPRIGMEKKPEELIASVRMALGRQGFAVSEDDATELLTFFALQDDLTVCAPTAAIGELYVRALTNALGLSNVTAYTRAGDYLTVASLLPENGQRTPTVEVSAFARAAVHAYGHKTLRIAAAQEVTAADGLPVATAPAYRPGTNMVREAQPAAPVMLESLWAFADAAAPLSPAGEAWFIELAGEMEQQGAPLAQTDQNRMRAFIAAASARLRGGFLVAADAAALGWVVPLARERRLNTEALRSTLVGLPRTLAALNIR